MEMTENPRKRAARVRDSQLNVMINYMIDHRDFACGRFEGPQGKVTAERQWQQLAELLAGHGPNKNAEQWKKVWKYLKGKARTRNAQVNAERGTTGNVMVESQLSDMDRKVLSIIGNQTSTPLFDGGTQSDDAESVNIEVEEMEPIIEVIVGESSTSLEGNMSSTNNGAVAETVIPPQRSCQRNRSSLLKELEAVAEKVDSYEERHLQLLKDINDSIRSGMRELTEINGRIASALERLTGSGSGEC